MIRRRDVLKAAALLPWTRNVEAAAAAAGPMKITKIDAVRFRPDLQMQGVSPNWTWVRLHTDTGITGLGESYPNHIANVGALRQLAPMLLGKDPTQIERLWQDLQRHVAIERGVVRPVHFAHPARSKGRRDLVVRDASAWLQGHLVDDDSTGPQWKSCA